MYSNRSQTTSWRVQNKRNVVTHTMTSFVKYCNTEHKKWNLFVFWNRKVRINLGKNLPKVYHAIRWTRHLCVCTIITHQWKYEINSDCCKTIFIVTGSQLLHIFSVVLPLTEGGADHPKWFHKFLWTVWQSCDHHFWTMIAMVGYKLRVLLHKIQSLNDQSDNLITEELHLYTHQTIFFCFSSIFNFSVMTCILKAGGGIWILRGKCGVEGYYEK